jgi:hypothetical protein
MTLKYTDMMQDGTLDVVSLLASKGRRDLAHQMLVRWAGRTLEPNARQLRAFVQASALLGDAGLPLGKLVQLARAGSDPDTQGQFAEELANAFGSPALTAITPLLTNKALLTRPLFAAELSLSAGNREMARWYLNRIYPSKLPPERQSDWLALLRRAEKDAEVFERLATLWTDGHLSPELAPLFADEAVKVGQVTTHDLICESMRQ